MQSPYEAYKGSDPYIFVSYAHRESATVYPELVWLKEQGCNVWYDEGIEAGTEWHEEIVLKKRGFWSAERPNSCTLGLSIQDNQQAHMVRLAPCLLVCSVNS